MVESFTLGLCSENLDDLSTSSECPHWHTSVGFESRSPLLALSANSCVTLGKLLDFSEAVSSCVNCQSQNIPHRGLHMGFPGGSEGKESACNEGDMGLIPGSGRSPREGNDNPLQYSYLENSMDRGAWWVVVHGVPKNLI